MATIQYYDKDFLSATGIISIPVVDEKEVPVDSYSWGFNTDANGNGYYCFWKSDLDDSVVAVDYSHERLQQEEDGDGHWWEMAAQDMRNDVEKFNIKHKKCQS